MKFLILLILSFNVFSQSVNPNNTLKIGKASSTADKGIIFDTNDGASNVKLQVDDALKLKLSGNTMQIGDGSSANNKELILDSASATSFKWNGSDNYVELRSEKVRIGEDANNDISLEFGKGGSNPALKYDSVKGKLAFSNDGALFKDIGSGSGGGSGGINILQNDNFEDGISTNWTSSGGTFSQQSFTNDTDDNLKYARFVASGSGQYFESDLYVIPDFLTGGCLAYLEKYKVAEADHNAFKLAVRDGSNEINSILLSSTNDKWLPSEPVAINCPTAGTSFKVRIESVLSSGQIEVDKVYLGSDNRLVSPNCQGIESCEDTFSAKATIASPAVVSGENLDWINGNCVRSGTGNSIATCTFNTGIFTLAPNCEATISGGNSRSTSVTSTASTVTIVTSTGAGVDEAVAFNLSCQKAGADFASAKPQNAVSNQSSAWFIDANIGGANDSLGGSSLTTYTEIANASWDMVLNNGSANAEIPCSSTNPSTGLTCSAGNESLGVAFNPPYTGYFDVCASFSQYNPQSGNTQSIYQLIETPNNAQTILQEGKERNSVGGAVPVSTETYHGVDVCGTFYFADTSKKTVRLMYEYVYSSGAQAQVVLDRSASVGQRDLRIKVKPSTRNIPAPVLTGNAVTTPSEINPILFNSTVSNACVVSDEFGGDWLGTGASSGTGRCAIPFSTPFLKVKCWTDAQNGGGNDSYCYTTTATSLSQVEIQCIAGGSPSAIATDVFCIGTK